MGNSSVLEALWWIRMEESSNPDDFVSSRHLETIHRKEVKTLKKELDGISEKVKKTEIIDNFLKGQLKEFLNKSKTDWILKEDATIDTFLKNQFDWIALREMIIEWKEGEFEKNYNKFVSSFVDIKINEVKESEYYQALTQFRQELWNLKSDLYGGLQHTQTKLEVIIWNNLDQAQKDLENSWKKLNKSSSKLDKVESKREKIVVREIEEYTIEAFKWLWHYFDETLEKEFWKQSWEKKKTVKLRKRFIVQMIFDELKKNDTATEMLDIILPEVTELWIGKDKKISIDLKDKDIQSSMDSIIYLRQFDKTLNGQWSGPSIRNEKTRNEYNTAAKKSEEYKKWYEWSLNELTEKRDALYNEYIKNIDIEDKNWFAVLLADLDFDTRAEISPKKEDSKYKTGFARFMFDKNQNGIKESSYRKAFEGIPKNTSLESQIKHSYLDAVALQGEVTVNENIVNCLSTISGKTLNWTDLKTELIKKENTGLLLDFRTFIMDNPIFIQRIFNEGSYGADVAYEQAWDVIISETNLDNLSSEFKTWFWLLSEAEKDQLNNNLDNQINSFFIANQWKIPESLQSPESRDSLRKALMFGGFQIMWSMTYQQSKDKLAFVDGKVKKTGVAEKWKLLFNALTIWTGAQLSLIEKDRFHLWAWLNLWVTWFRRTDPESFKKELAFGIGLSLGLDGVVDVGKKIGNTDITKWHVFFGAWVWAWIWGWANFAFGPYAYLWWEWIINVDKLTSTLDPTSSKYLWMSASVSWAWPTANAYFRKDRFEWLEIIRDSIHTKYADIFTRILTNSKWKDLNQETIKNEIISELTREGKFDRTKLTTIDYQANRLCLMMRFYNPTDTIEDAEISLISERLAYYYALNWKNENSMLYENKIEFSGINIGIESLFWLSSLWINKKTKAVMYDDPRSVEENKIALENNQWAQELITDDWIKVIIGERVNNINSLIGNYIWWTKEYFTHNSTNGTVSISKEILGKVEIRMSNYYKTYCKQGDDGSLMIPDDMASGLSTIMQANTTKAILALWYTVDEPIVDFTVWDGKNGWSGAPEKYETRWAITIDDLSLQLKEIDINPPWAKWWESKPLSNMSFTYVEPKLTLMDWPNELGTVDIPELLLSTKIINITKKSDGKFELGTTDPTTTKWITNTWITLNYKEENEIIWSASAVSPLSFETPADFKLNGDFENQFTDQKLLFDIIFRKLSPYKATYNAFSMYMVKGDFNNAKIQATKLLTLLWKNKKINNKITFSETWFKKELLRFESLLIYSNVCKCNLDQPNWDISFTYKGKSWKDWLMGLMDFRSSFDTKSTVNFPRASATLVAARNASKTALSAKSSYTFATKSNAVWIVFGYPQDPEVKNQLEEKLVYEPKYIEGSIQKLTISDEAAWSELLASFDNKLRISEWEDRLKTKLLAKVTWDKAKNEISQNITDIQTAIKNWSTYTGDFVSIDSNFQFFLYPHCANEWISLDLDVKEKTISTDIKSASRILTPKEWLPTGFYTNLLANANTVSIGQLQAWVWAKVNTVKIKWTIPRVNIEIDGKTIPILLPEWTILTQIPDGSRKITTKNWSSMNISQFWSNGTQLQYDINVYNPDGSIQFSNTIVFDPNNTWNLVDMWWASTQDLQNLFASDPDILQSLKWFDWWLRQDPAYANLDKNQSLINSNEPMILQNYREFISKNFKNLDPRQTMVQQYQLTPWFNNLLEWKIITREQYSRIKSTYDYTQQIKVLEYYQKKLKEHINAKR